LATFSISSTSKDALIFDVSFNIYFVPSVKEGLNDASSCIPLILKLISAESSKWKNPEPETFELLLSCLIMSIKVIGIFKSYVATIVAVPRFGLVLLYM
jgi:hypothetical protein